MSNLPYDAQIEYLESSGTQLLDTGISGGTSVEYSLLIEFCGGNSRWAQYFGSSNNERCCPKLFRWDNSPYVGHTYAAWYTTSETQFRIGELNINSQYLVEYKGGKLYLNGSELASPGTLGFGSNNFCIFGYLPEPQYKSKLRLYECKIWKDGTLVRDMIPVRVGQVGYMYDKVSEQLFGNAGTGDFILGNDKALPNPFGFRRRLITVRLPYDAEVEYLESTGTQYIDTDIKLFDVAPVSFDINIVAFVETGQVPNACILNAMKEVSPYPGVVIRVNSNIIQRSGAGGEANIGSCGELTRIDVSANNVNSQHSVNTTIFAGLDGNGNPWRYCKLKLYSCILIKNGNIVFNAKPVRVGQVGYLYDKVSETLLGNSGTGDFILGKDKALPNPFGFRRRLMIASKSLPYDAEVFYLESTGTQYIDTGIKLFDVAPVSFDINIVAFVETGQVPNACILNAMEEVSPYPGEVIRVNGNIIQQSGVGGEANIGRCGELTTIDVSANNVNSQHSVNTTIFAGLAGNGIPWRYCKLKLYSCILIKNGNIVFNAKPVRVGQVGYLYDKVSKQLFGNNGTGNFIVGNDINT